MRLNKVKRYVSVKKCYNHNFCSADFFDGKNAAHKLYLKLYVYHLSKILSDELERYLKDIAKRVTSGCKRRS